MKFKFKTKFNTLEECIQYWRSQQVKEHIIKVSPSGKAYMLCDNGMKRFNTSQEAIRALNGDEYKIYYAGPYGSSLGKIIKVDDNTFGILLLYINGKVKSNTEIYVDYRCGNGHNIEYDVVTYNNRRYVKYPRYDATYKTTHVMCFNDIDSQYWYETKTNMNASILKLSKNSQDIINNIYKDTKQYKKCIEDCVFKYITNINDIRNMFKTIVGHKGEIKDQDAILSLIQKITKLDIYKNAAEHENIVIRHDNYITILFLKRWEKIFFIYDINTNKKYMYTICSYWRCNTVLKYWRMDHFNKSLLYDNTYTFKCYNKSEAVHPSVCFDGINRYKNIISYCLNIESCISDTKTIKTKELLNNNTIPKYILQFIFDKEEMYLIKELLLKSGYINIFSSITCEYRIDSDFIFKIKPKKTSLKNMLYLSKRQLDILNNDIRISKSSYTNSMGLKNTINNNRHIRALQEVLLDKLPSISDDMFIKYVNIENRGYYNISDKIRAISEYTHKGAIEVLNIMLKINDVYTYIDYLRSRNEFIKLSKTITLQNELNENRYPIMPTKGKYFVRLYAYRNRYGCAISVSQQLYEFKNKYKDVEFIEDNDTNLTAVILRLTQEESIRFLHDEINTYITLYIDEIKQREFEPAVKRVKSLEYTNGTLSIVAPKTIDDIREEGSVLHHCVYSFINPIINNTENVLFIRRNDMLDVPFYTLAISNDGIIEQVHCYGNGDLTEQSQEQAYNFSKIESYNKTFDIVEFLNDWAEHKKSVNKNTIQINYRALCAKR